MTIFAPFLLKSDSFRIRSSFQRIETSLDKQNSKVMTKIQRAQDS